LGIRPKTNYSAEKRERSLSYQCIEKIRFLHFKKAFDPALLRFREQATILYSGWVRKPKAERGVVPEATRNKPRQVTERERVQRLRLLLLGVEGRHIEMDDREYTISSAILKQPGS
jgi:hypothetical protein